VITKHPGTGGLVSVGTVTSQLLYEISGPRYLNPDVVARFDTIRVEAVGSDRVRVSGVRGEPAPPTVKVCINYEGGYRNSTSFCLTGLEIEEKADLVERTFWGGFPRGRETFASTSSSLVRSDHDDPGTNEEAVAVLTLTAKDPDARKVGRAFANVAVEMGLSSYPGLFGRGGPGEAQAYGVYWPALVPSDLCWNEVVVEGNLTVVDNTPPDLGGEPVVADLPLLPAVPGGPTVRAPLGRVVGARSGDKGGNANVGLFARTPEAFAWLEAYLTVDRLRELFPEARAHDVERYDLPNLLSLNFVFKGLLGEGVASSTRMDGQAKGLGEYLRARVVDIPASLLTSH
jgi:hypothetical protein